MGRISTGMLARGNLPSEGKSLSTADVPSNYHTLLSGSRIGTTVEQGLSSFICHPPSSSKAHMSKMARASRVSIPEDCCATKPPAGIAVVLAARSQQIFPRKATSPTVAEVWMQNKIANTPCRQNHELGMQKSLDTTSRTLYYSADGHQRSVVGS